MLGSAWKPGGATADSIPGDRSVIITLSSEKDPEPFGVSSSSCNRDVRSPEIFRRGEESELLEGSFAWPAIVATRELQLGQADQQPVPVELAVKHITSLQLKFDLQRSLVPRSPCKQSMVWERDYLQLLRIYHFGGYNGHSNHNSLHCLNTATLEWTEIHSQTPGNQPMPKSACGMVTYHDETVGVTSIAVLAGYGTPVTPIQPGSTFIPSTEFTDGRGWTNEFHLFNLTNGM